MTHQPYPPVSDELVELVNEHGFDGMAQIMQQLVNECMKIERQQVLGVGPYQRSEQRNGQANGFKPKRMKTRVGELELSACAGPRSEVLSDRFGERLAERTRPDGGPGRDVRQGRIHPPSDEDRRRALRLRSLFQRRQPCDGAAG